MKNIASCLAAFIMAGTLFTLVSCQKEPALNKDNQTSVSECEMLMSKGPVTRAYRDSFDIDLQFFPDIAAGWKYPNNAPVWFPGDGKGNATHMGNAGIYFNVYTTKNADNVTMVYGRPVNQFYGSQLQSFNLPSEVNAIIIDGKGNSIWEKIGSGGLPSWHFNQKYVGMTGTVQIIGGTGKFAGATGETTINVVFNQLDLKEASLWQNGWIKY